MIIVFSGTDGAGKSTQIDKLAHYYQSKGKKTHYFWSRGGYTPGFSAIKSLARKLLKKKLPTQGQSNHRDEILKKGAVSNLWLTLAIIDLMFFYGIYLRVLSLMGKVVICDRYIDDTQLDFTHNFANTFSNKSFMWKMLRLVTPTPNKSFLLYVPVSVSQYRSTLKNEPFPDSQETLEFRLKNYLDESLFPSQVYQKIECQQSVDDIHQLITQAII